MGVRSEELADGDSVKVAKKSVVVDKDRIQEGLPEDQRTPLESDVTGVTGSVCGTPYFSKEKGEMCVPVTLRSGAVIGVPESRLDVPTGNPARIGYSRRYADQHDRIFGKKKKERTRT